MDSLDQLVGHLKTEYGITTPERAAQWLAGEADSLGVPVSNTPFLITFDDGFVSNLYAARQVLKPHNVSALFFVCPGLTDLSVEQQEQEISAKIFDGKFATHPLSKGQRLMSWEELIELSSLGHTIGAHGMFHRRLSLLEKPELEHEIANCTAIMEEQLDRRVDWYAYAFGDIASISASALQIIGEHFRFCRSGVRGRNLPGNRLLFAEELGLQHPFSYQMLVVDGGIDFIHWKNRSVLKSLSEIKR